MGGAASPLTAEPWIAIAAARTVRRVPPME